MRIYRHVALALLAASPFTAAFAQRVIHAGVSGGLTPSIAGSPDREYRGSHLQAGLELTPPERVLGLRLDVFVHNMTRRPYPMLSGHTRIVGGTASAIFSMPAMGERATPYLLVGAGTYRTEYGSPTYEMHFGLAAGAGLRVQTGPAAWFAEVRVHQIQDGSTPRLVPISIGVRF